MSLKGSMTKPYIIRRCHPEVRAFRGLKAPCNWLAVSRCTQVAEILRFAQDDRVSAFSGAGPARQWAFLPGRLRLWRGRRPRWLAPELPFGCIARIPGSGAAFLPCARASAG